MKVSKICRVKAVASGIKLQAFEDAVRDSGLLTCFGHLMALLPTGSKMLGSDLGLVLGCNKCPEVTDLCKSLSSFRWEEDGVFLLKA